MMNRCHCIRTERLFWWGTSNDARLGGIKADAGRRCAFSLNFSVLFSLWGCRVGTVSDARNRQQRLRDSEREEVLR